jgi:hypothetical protein
MTEHVDYAVLAKRALELLSVADRQLVAWHQERSRWDLNSRGDRDQAIGYLLMRALGREVSPKTAKACLATLDAMRTERMREIARKAA